MSGPQITLLITLTGRDRPGVTSRLFSVLAGHELNVIDVEQVVIRGPARARRPAVLPTMRPT